MKFSLTTQMAEVQREVEMRERVYPGQVMRGKMRKAEADYRIDCMRAVAASLLKLIEIENKAAAIIGADGDGACGE